MVSAWPEADVRLAGGEQRQKSDLVDYNSSTKEQGKLGAERNQCGLGE